MSEVNVLAEGTLRWVEASGTALTWQTGDSVPTAQDTAAWAARSGLVGYVQAGWTFGLQQNWGTIMDRGVVSHHKLTDTPFVEARFTVLAGVTGDYPSGNTAIGPSALGFSEPPRFNFEFRSRRSELPSPSSLFYHLNNAVIPSKNYAEQPEGNTKEFVIRALSALGPTGSGYLS